MGNLEENQYLAFGIDNETYAVPVGKVREVLEYMKPTRLPKTADFMKGIINVRGAAIPVIDLRVKFGLPEIPISKDTAILVLEIAPQDSQTLVIGALADEVHEVIEIRDEHLEPAPRFGSRIDSGFIHSVGKKDDKFIIILDIDKAFYETEINALSEAFAAAD